MLKELAEKLQGKVPRGTKRDSLWPMVRANHLRREPTCQVCGGNKKLEVHHKIPFHVNPSRELDPTNLITLCEAKKKGVNCHLFFGHFGDYRRYNDDVVIDALLWSQRLRVGYR
jgi:hypothetical protein